MFAKVFTSLWQGSMVGKPDVQLVFVFLLANANAHGEADYFPAVIASLTGLPMDRVQAALTELESPDPYSRTPDDEGRRLIRLDEHRTWGWRIVNYAKYRKMRDEEGRREQTRRATERWRELHHERTGFREPLVSHSEPLVSQGEPPRAQEEVEVEADSRTFRSPRSRAATDSDWVDGFHRLIWTVYPRKVGKLAALTAWSKIKPQTQEQFDAVDSALQRSMSEWQAEGRELRHIPHLSTWLNQKRYLDGQDSAGLGESGAGSVPSLGLVENAPQGKHGGHRP